MNFMYKSKRVSRQASLTPRKNLRPLYGGDLRVVLNGIRFILCVKKFHVDWTFSFGAPDL